MQFQLIRMPAIVRIDEGEQLAAGLAYPGISRAREPTIFSVPNDMDTLIAEFFADPDTVIGRLIIDDQEFKIFETLVEYRSHGIANKFFHIINGHDDANFWHG